MGGLVHGRLLIWGDAMCLRARIRSFKPPQLHFLPFYHNLEVDKDCLVTQFCLFCIVTSLKILASYTLLPLLMYSCKFQLRNSIFIILYTVTCALNDQSCRCAIKQHSFIHYSYYMHDSIGNSLMKLLRKRETSVEMSIKCQGKSFSCQGNVGEFWNCWNVGTLQGWSESQDETQFLVLALYGYEEILKKSSLKRWSNFEIISQECSSGDPFQKLFVKF